MIDSANSFSSTSNLYFLLSELSFELTCWILLTCSFKLDISSSVGSLHIASAEFEPMLRRLSKSWVRCTIRRLRIWISSSKLENAASFRRRLSLSSVLAASDLVAKSSIFHKRVLVTELLRFPTIFIASFSNLIDLSSELSDSGSSTCGNLERIRSNSLSTTSSWNSKSSTARLDSVICSSSSLESASSCRDFNSSLAFFNNFISSTMSLIKSLYSEAFVS
mmetsp:Transcript_19532/g.29576  ORF Transcript_19532/g.29576 Transcript_19532/m.29576 type:complete len:221 (-) Transcript_19532:2115-2777(-)